MKRTAAIVLFAALATSVSVNLTGQQPNRPNLASELSLLASTSEHLDQVLADLAKHNRDAEQAEQQIANIPEERIALSNKLFTEGDPAKAAALKQQLEALTTKNNELKAGLTQSRSGVQTALSEAQATAKRIRAKLDELKRLQ